MSTLNEIIQRVDENKPNAFCTAQKVRWIAELDGRIALDVMLMDVSEAAQLNYTEADLHKKEPLISFPHDDIYVYWLEAKIDEQNGEYNKYQNAMELYNAYYESFVNWFLSKWQPAQGYGCDGLEPNPDAVSYYITAYGLAVKHGFTGTIEEWLASLKGDKGEKGDKGDKGDKGNKGDPGWVNVDETLSLEGYAADAKATGDATSKLKHHAGYSVVLKTESDNGAIRVVTVLNETEEPVQTIHLKRSMMGKPLFGGEELANALVSLSEATLDTGNKTVTFNGKNAQGDVYYEIPEEDREEGKQYTFILYGRNATTKGTSLNMRFKYTDGTYSGVFTADPGKVGYSVYVSSQNKTLHSIVGMYNASSNTILHYELCGLFEGVHTADEYKVLTATFEKGVTSGIYNWNTGLLTSGDYTEQLSPQEMTLLKGENEIFTNDGVNHVDQIYVPHVDCTLTKHGDAADAGEVGYRLGSSSQGYHAAYDITQGPGWYRAAIMIRSASGIVEMAMVQNKPAVGRFAQNLIFGFTGFAEIVSPNFDSNADYPRDRGARPHIFQIANHTYGEDFEIAAANDRAIRIDKVRISYPKIWTDQADENEEYRNPINIFLDFHVTGPDIDWEDNLIDPRFELNMTAHTQNHRCVPITSELPCRIDGDENVLGEFGEVACDTYEFELVDNHGFYVEEASVFEQLTALKKLWADEDADINFGHSVIRGVAPGEEDGDAVNYAQMRDYVSKNVGGGTGGGGASADEVIEELGKTRIPYMAVEDAEVKRAEVKCVLLTDVGGEGINVEHAGQNVLSLHETADGNNVILRGIAAAEQDTDAVNKAQLDAAVVDIESALDRIIEIQNYLIGGEA